MIAAAAFAAGIALYRPVTEPSGPVFPALVCALSGAGLFFLSLKRFVRSFSGKPGNAQHSAEPCAETEPDKKLEKGRRALALILIFLMAGMLRAALCFSTVSGFEGMDGKEADAAGRIVHAEQKDENTVSAVVLILPDHSSGSKDKSGAGKERILATIVNCPVKAYCLTGREAVFSGKLKKPSSASNPGSFDYSMYLRSRKILYTMKADWNGIRWTADKGGYWKILRMTGKWKTDYGEKLSVCLGEKDAGVLRGILFGEDQYMEEELRESFGENGIGHLLAASGLHAGFVYALLYALCGRPVTLKRNLPVLGTLLIYAAMADFSPSVVRAVWMITVSAVGRIRFRRGDFLTGIAFCGSSLLVYEPSLLWSSGFQLSFSAVLSLAIVLPAIERFTEEKNAAGRLAEEETEKEWLINFKKKASETLLASAALQAGMIPVMLKHFHYISAAGMALNIPAIALAGYIVPLGLLLMPGGVLWENGFLSGIPFSDSILTAAFRLEDLPLRILLGINERTAAGGHSCFYAASPPAAVFLIYYGLLLLLCTEGGSRFRKDGFSGCRPAFALAAAAWILFSCSLGFLTDGFSRQADLVFVDVGQGDCAHLRVKGGNVLFDSGGSEFRDVGKDILMPYFLGNGVGEIDLAVLSHLHTDHYRGLCTLKEYVPVRRLALSAAYRSVAGQIEEETGVPEERMLFLERGDRFLFRGAEFIVLAPEHRSEEEYAEMVKDDKEENNCSLVVRAEYKGVSALFTGDISSDLEKKLIGSVRETLRSDVLSAAHHGSRYSTCTPFLQAVSPSLCVIQVGLHNMYGHPAPETLDRIKEEGCRLCRNDLQGAVMLQFRSCIQVNTMR